MKEKDIYLQKYYEDCKLRKRLNEKTLKAYKIDLTQFFNFTEGELINNKLIIDYVHFLNEKYTKYKTVKRKIASLKAFYKYLEFEEIIAVTPFNRIRTKIKEPKLLPKTIATKDMLRILKCLYDDYKNAHSQYKKFLALRNIVIIELLFGTGIRISELCHLEKKDINLSDKSLTIFGKGSKERILFLGNDAVIEVLKKFMNLHNEKTNYLFLNKYGQRLSEQAVRLLINDLEKRLSLSIHITPHMFRHTFATRLLEKDVDIRYIQKILGHSSISTTQIYTHVSCSKQKEIMTNKNPRNDYSSYIENFY